MGVPAIKRNYYSAGKCSGTAADDEKRMSSFHLKTFDNVLADISYRKVS